MYFQRDYVLRMIEMMGELVRRLCSIAQEADALRELDEICQKACGMPLAMLRTENPDTLADLFSEPQRFLAAELLEIDIEIGGRKQADEELLPRRQQALALYASLDDPDYMLAAADRSAEMLEKTLDQLPVQSLLGVAALCERSGRFASAEDALYAAAELWDGAKAEAEAFYDRLDALDDRALLAGGFSREEIAEGRDAIAGM